jgi:hypothetical protein
VPAFATELYQLMRSGATDANQSEIAHTNPSGAARTVNALIIAGNVIGTPVLKLRQFSQKRIITAYPKNR